MGDGPRRRGRTGYCRRPALRGVAGAACLSKEEEGRKRSASRAWLRGRKGELDGQENWMSSEVARGGFLTDGCCCVLLGIGRDPIGRVSKEEETMDLSEEGGR